MLLILLCIQAIVQGPFNSRSRLSLKRAFVSYVLDLHQTVEQLRWQIPCDVTSRVTEPVLSEATPAPPQNVHVNKWLLTWTPSEEAEEGNVTYTVQYRSFDTSVWEAVPDCVHTSFNSCNVSLTKAESEQDCVILRVRAERHGLTSKPVKACSRHGDICSPEVSLTARPGSLTVHLSRNNTMTQEHGDLVKYRVFFAKEGEQMQFLKEAASSVHIPELEEGQRYCTKVQYMYINRHIGRESCTQCEVVPPGHEPKQIAVIALVVVAILVIMISVISYILIFQRRRIKQFLRPPYEIPVHFHLVMFPEHGIPSSTSSPIEEHHDVISCIREREQSGGE